MRILQSRIFKNSVKQLHANQKRDLDDAVRVIMADPTRGEAKVGDLAGVRVHKFKMSKQPTLMAYEWNSEADAIILLALGSHENFYRDLKRSAS
ncbi:MAG: type II toxin-antitoxin system RelE/ParE family toxin [Magnetococcales bacterium]|nr:type II toxin-antitoxin system RelE/ParE family toxin [Magnetococcales bacterium]MBF0151120.1 type II toxin-antitoxin system RelE/ParE family toxin [Magnetococcales bacterium]MBF0175124.1 type II toxin-antitoxin system RelE/ParE family toxin [Magnetococcales bacterium]MBF0348938.1 type II toxin-antitoxin system RelE/ParE family toxin [Magnetococcales bacterium]